MFVSTMKSFVKLQGLPFLRTTHVKVLFIRNIFLDLQKAACVISLYAGRANAAYPKKKKKKQPYPEMSMMEKTWAEYTSSDQLSVPRLKLFSADLFLVLILVCKSSPISTTGKILFPLVKLMHYDVFFSLSFLFHVREGPHFVNHLTVLYLWTSFGLSGRLSDTLLAVNMNRRDIGNKNLHNPNHVFNLNWFPFHSAILCISVLNRIMGFKAGLANWCLNASNKINSIPARAVNVLLIPPPSHIRVYLRFINKVWRVLRHSTAVLHLATPTELHKRQNLTGRAVKP